MKDECNDTFHKVRYVTQEEVLDMAIKALEQEPSGDLISRQLAIDTMAKLEQEDIDTYGCSIPEGFDGEKAIEALKQLPFVNLQERTGHWMPSHIPESILDECSECGFSCGAFTFNYCPNCGAKMVEKPRVRIGNNTYYY
jgi:predicted Zn-ribbon and HTH transcriptional regulator